MLAFANHNINYNIFLFHFIGQQLLVLHYAAPFSVLVSAVRTTCMLASQFGLAPTGDCGNGLRLFSCHTQSAWTAS